MELSPVSLICILQLFGSYIIQDQTMKFTLTFVGSFGAEDRQNLARFVGYFNLIIPLVYLLIADGLPYRWIIILSTFSLSLRYIAHFFPSVILSTYVSSIAQIFYLVSITASLPYLYAKIKDTSKYQKITAYVTACGLLGKLFGHLWNWFYFSTFSSVRTGSDRIAFALTQPPIYINAIILCIPIFCSYILPPVYPKRSNDAESTIEDSQDIRIITSNEDIVNETHNTIDRLQLGILHQWNNFKMAYTNCNVLKWSIWYSITSYMYPAVQTYSWLVLHVSRVAIPIKLHHMLTLISSVLILILLFLCSRNSTNWKTRGDLVLCSVSFILSVLTTLLYLFIDGILQAVLIYIFKMLAEIFLCVCLWEIVQIIPRNSYALVMGFNMFVTRILNAILQAVDIDSAVNADIMLTHAIVFAVMGIGFGLSAKSVFRRT